LLLQGVIKHVSQKIFHHINGDHDQTTIIMTTFIKIVVKACIKSLHSVLITIFSQIVFFFLYLKGLVVVNSFQMHEITYTS
jgi:hypothetical protein